MSEFRTTEAYIIKQPKPTMHYTSYGMIQDDLSVEWYLHWIMGEKVTPAICKELIARIKREKDTKHD